MFIRSQNRIQVVDIGKVTRIYAEPRPMETMKNGDEKINLKPPFKIYASDGSGVDPFLGEYDNRARAEDVLDEICAAIHGKPSNHVFYMPLA